VIAVKGVYALVISVRKNIRINVGALGAIDFQKDLYVYVGSAQNGLEKRVLRHLRKYKRKFWHIDYLLDGKSVKVLKVFYQSRERSEECRIATRIGKHGVRINGFGSSDCRCESHLFKVKDYLFLRSFMQELLL
jgi:Uri superfamily endonuclease